MSKQQKQVLTKSAARVVLMAAMLGFTLPAPAVIWNLADTPLYLGNSIPANLMFLIDDSGSMDWDTMTQDHINDGLFGSSQPDGTSSGTDGGIINRPGCTVGGAGQTLYSGATGYSYATEFAGNKYNGSCNIAGDQEWRFRNSDFNPMYFNPKKEYKPWSGTDQSGVLFGNISPTQAWNDPYTKNYTGGGEWIDLTTKGTATSSSGSGDRHVILAGGVRFYTWADTNGNKKFDNLSKGDTVTEYAIGSLTPAQVKPDWFGATAADPVAAVKTNFANWFSYYRARHLVAKSAFGKVAGNVNNMRLGMVTIHNTSGVNTGLRLIDSNPTGEANRTNLMNNLYRITPGSSTPLLSALKQVGKYLSGLSNNLAVSETAPLPVSQGGECQQNFTLVMTDGFYNGVYNPSSPAPTIGDADGDKSSSFDNKLYPLAGQTTPLYHDPVAVTKTMADIAMYYYENDIVAGVANKVPVNPGVDENKAQHMVTFTIAFGLSGDLKGMPEEYLAHKPSATCLAATPCTTEWNNGVFPGWPVPASSTKTSDYFTDKQKIDDVRHAAYNGRGEFLAAQNPDELANSLESMLASIQKRTSASAGLSFNSTTVRTTTMVFQGRYVTSDWVGNLHFLPILQDGTIGSELAQTATILKTQAPTDRVIITYNSDLGDAVPFRWTNVGATWQTALGVGGSYILDFLRGDHSCETKSLVACGGTKSYRNRSWEMGDIINSAPAYVGTPSAGYTFNGYNGTGGFIATQASRTPVVYVGANDGMLHGFDASINSDGTKTATTGKELLAYAPGVLRNKVKNLSDPSYDHKYYVDGTPTTGDVEFGAGNWRSVLVGGLRAGGQAMFALDVTNPGTFSEATASAIHLWEFSDANDIDLGYTFSEPSIARLGDDSWAAIFGNGYNSTEADGKVGSGNAVLYVVNVQTGAVIRKLDTLTGPLQDPACVPACTVATGHANGLSGVTVVDVDGDDKADFVYAGDLFGNMWRFDISAANPGSWNVSFGGKPLFVSRSKEGNAQPITVRPAVGEHTLGTGYMVYFGTGKYIEASDNSSIGQPTQNFYGLWDKWAKGSSTAFTAFTRTNLVMQEILSETGGTRVDTDNPVDWTTKQGWYLDLVVKGAVSNQGERVITEPVLRGGSVLFTTLIPATAICEFGGTGWLMVLDNSNGGKLDQSPVDTNNDGKFDKNDTIVSGLKSENGIPSAPAVISGAGGTVDWVAMNFSNGSLGGTGYNEPTPPIVPPCEDCATDAPAATPADGVRSSGLRGRLSWERIK